MFRYVIPVFTLGVLAFTTPYIQGDMVLKLAVRCAMIAQVVKIVAIMTR